MTEFTFTAEVMPLPPHLPWWHRWALKLLRRPLPTAPQPPGTVQLEFVTHNYPSGTVTRHFYPAARIHPVKEG